MTAVAAKRTLDDDVATDQKEFVDIGRTVDPRQCSNS